MAIKIIKSGNKLTPYRVTCPRCSCEFEYELEDLHQGYSNMGYLGGRYVACPCCGQCIKHAEDWEVEPISMLRPDSFKY